jgi:hypothetical protein
VSRFGSSCMVADEVNSPARIDSRPVSKTGLDVLCPEPIPGSNINNGIKQSKATASTNFFGNLDINSRS